MKFLLVFLISLCGFSMVQARPVLTLDVARGLALASASTLEEVDDVLGEMKKLGSSKPLKTYRDKIIELHNDWLAVNLTESEKTHLSKYSSCSAAVGAMRTFTTQVLSPERTDTVAIQRDLAKHQKLCEKQLKK